MKTKQVCSTTLPHKEKTLWSKLLKSFASEFKGKAVTDFFTAPVYGLQGH